jgi:hypothetical protein
LPAYVKDKNVLPVMEEDVFKLTVKYGRRNGVSIPDNFEMLVSGEDKVLALIQENLKITAELIRDSCFPILGRQCRRPFARLPATRGIALLK